MCEEDMYARPLRQFVGSTSSPDSRSSGRTATNSTPSSSISSAPHRKHDVIFTPVHEMYGKHEEILHNHTKWLMVLDNSTGSGDIVWYNITAGAPPLYKQASKKSTCEMLIGLQKFAVVSFCNKVFVSGGFDTKDGSPVASLLMYDADKQEWRVLMGMHKSRSQHTMIEWKNQLLVTGGITDSQGRMTHTTEVYNPEKDEWTLSENLPEPRAAHASVLHDGDVYISGGYNQSMISQNHTWVYEQSTSRWRQLDDDYPVSLPEANARHHMVSHYDSIYILTGTAGREVISFKPEISYMGTGALSKDIQRIKYDRVTPWSYKNLQITRVVADSALYKNGNTMVVFGGCLSDGNINDNFIYIDLETGTVSSFPSKTGLSRDCSCAEIEVNRYLSLSQHLVQRNWPLW